MEPRKNNALDEERRDRPDQAGISSTNNLINDEDNLDTRNVANNIEEGDEDYDDEGELEESDFDVDDEDEEDDDEEIV